MKKIFVLFAFLPFVGSAFAGACVPYWDAEGFERFKCDPEKLAAAFIADMQNRRPPITVEIKDYSPDSLTFTLIIHSENITLRCRKFGDRATCE